MALVCARMPDIVRHGRFWAEEGRYFFRDACTMPWWRALLFPVGGYLNLVADAAGLLAHTLVPLRWAPYATIAVALLCQSCPALLVLTARDAWLRPPLARVAAIVLLATPVASDEVWLDSIHSQFHLGLAAALVLALEPVRGLPGGFRLGLLFVAPLAGPTALFLLPLFGLRLAIARDRARLAQTAVLALAGAIQLLGFYTAAAGRSFGIDPAMLAAVAFVRHLVLPLSGRDAAGGLGDRLHALALRGIVPAWAVLPALAAFGLLAIAAARARVRAAAWLLLPALLIEILGDYGAIDGRAKLLWAAYAERYAFVPSALLSLSLLALAADRDRPATRAVAALLVAWIAVVGVRDAIVATDPTYAHGPDWGDQVRRWRRDPTRPLSIWPRGWDMRLPPP